MGKRLITQRRGRGFGRYKSPRHLRFTDASHPRMREGVGVIVDLVHEPGRIAPLAKALLGRAPGDLAVLKLPEGEQKLSILAVEYS